ncbi:MAG TPA: IS21-like element helper ATPase IstB, partial [Bacteroidales bacterium]|nr:IS21-like element helper ATPase IstB [Bacteroidales bacterium]
MKANTKTQAIMDYASQLKLSGIHDTLEEIITDANQQKSSYADFALSLLKLEVDHRNKRDLERRQKTAWLPLKHDMEDYDHSFTNGVSRQQINQLRECMWLEQTYNLVLMGPSGVGKTYLAAGLCSDALKKGYKAYFRTMEQIMEMLKLKDITRSAGVEYKRLLKAHLLVIDDIMLFALDKQQAVALFNFINHLHEKASFIVTTNKSPEEWVNLLDDEVVATALLDRILYHCEVIRLSGKSYRMENRKTI